MSGWQKGTGLVILAVAALLIVWDFVVGYLGGAEATESHLMLSFAREYPIIPFAFGVLMGHLFASQSTQNVFKVFRPRNKTECTS